MRVCDQFTNERAPRFFQPVSHEMEVHSSVDLHGTPTVRGIGVDLPMVIIGTEGLPRRAQSPLRLPEGVLLGQGEKILGIPSYRTVNNNTTREPVSMSRDQTIDAFGDPTKRGSDVLKGISHMVVTIDSITRYEEHELIKDGLFEGRDAILLPVNEPIPFVDEKLENRSPFAVRGLVSNTGELVSWSGKRNWASTIVDLCVLNAYACNRAELHILNEALGMEPTLIGTLSARPEVAAYLEAFDNKTINHPPSAASFVPHFEPKRHDTSRRFPELTRRETARLEYLTDVAYRGGTTPDRSKLR